ncbi:MAG: DUF6463 family protein [Methanomassiliicoccaceae archaeon]|nr:DUF6463 family protein [Methanomassiliicoccaceae archaeon]
MSIAYKRPMELWRYSGILLIATGMIHVAVGIALGGEFLWAIVKDGLLNAVGDYTDGKFASWWFAMAGIFVIMLGHVLHHYIKKEQRPAPRFVGYYLICMSAIGCIVEPASGFWLFIPQALIIIFAERSGN